MNELHAISPTLCGQGTTIGLRIVFERCTSNSLRVVSVFKRNVILSRVRYYELRETELIGRLLIGARHTPDGHSETIISPFADEYMLPCKVGGEILLFKTDVVTPLPINSHEARLVVSEGGLLPDDHGIIRERNILDVVRFMRL